MTKVDTGHYINYGHGQTAQQCQSHLVPNRGPEEERKEKTMGQTVMVNGKADLGTVNDGLCKQEDYVSGSVREIIFDLIEAKGKLALAQELITGDGTNNDKPEGPECLYGALRIIKRLTEDILTASTKINESIR